MSKKQNGTDTTEPKPRRARKPRTDSAAARLEKVLARIDKVTPVIEANPTPEDLDRVALVLGEAIVIGKGDDVEAFLRSRLGL